jgi:hypothetical protein
MNKRPSKAFDPSWIAVGSAFVFLIGMLVGSSETMQVGGGLLVLTGAAYAVSWLRHTLQVRLQPAAAAQRRR